MNTTTTTKAVRSIERIWQAITSKEYNLRKVTETDTRGRRRLFVYFTLKADGRNAFKCTKRKLAEALQTDLIFGL